MQKCDHCGWNIPDDSHVCPYCGSPVESADEERRRRFMLRWHLNALLLGMQQPSRGFLLSPAPPGPRVRGRPAVTILVSLASVLTLATLIAGLFTFQQGNIGYAQTPPPALILSGNIVPGGNISVQGRNFSPGGSVTFTIDGHTAKIVSGSSPEQHLPGTDGLALVSLSLSQLAPQTAKTPSGGTSVPVKSDGTFEATIQVDPHWPVGSPHLLVATEQSSGQHAHVTITVPHRAELVSCSHSTATTNIALGPVLEGQKQPVSTIFTLCTTGSGMLQWTASWDQQQAKWLQVDRTGQIQAPLWKQFMISASAGSLTAGTYSATVTFSDQNSPTKISLKVMFIVRSAQATDCLNTSMASLSFTATQGQPSPSPQSVKLSNCGNPGSWSATTHTDDGANWLSLSPASGQLEGKSSFDISVAISSSRLGQGIYTGQVTFKIGTGMAVVNVLLIVQPSGQNPPCISVAPQSLTFSAMQGQGNPDSQVATVGNCGPAGSWSATASTADGGNWLNINPATGNLAANATQDVSITVSSANLQIGTYSGLVTFKMGSSMATVSLAFTILQEQQKPCLSVNTPSLPFTGAQGQGDPAPQTITLTNCGPSGSWSASTANGSSWLGITPSSGNLNTGATQDVSVSASITRLSAVQYDVSVSASIAGLSAVQYNGTITFTISTGSGKASAPVAVSLTVQPPPPAQLCNIMDANLGELQQGQSTSGVITFDNCGGQPLQWSASFHDGWGGVTLNNSSGTVAPKGTGQIPVTATAGSGDQGQLPATFAITSNGGSGQAIVSVTVVPPPVLRTLTSQQTQSQTVNATGQGTTPGTQASGMLRVENHDSSNPLTIKAGTILPNQNPNPAIHMQIDQDVTLPPIGYTDVPAHVVEAGTIGNLPGPCCGTGPDFQNQCASVDNCGPPTWDIFNATAFTGGTDPQTYSVVQQSDIDTAANALQASTGQSAMADLNSQLQPNEHLIGNPQCTYTITSDHAAGDQATTVTVTVMATCTVTAST
jgi:predicted nucleic acid-binding Zn ribbon protein